jgi:hypothetical protein
MSQTNLPPIFVYDLDETIVNPDAMEDNDFERHKIPDVVEHLRLARATPGAILLLLTNNGDRDYIQSVDKWLGKGEEFFDRIWYYYSPGRTRMRSKSLQDVGAMLQELGQSTQDLQSRVYFFDDQPHKMDKELKDGHKFTIQPSQNNLVVAYDALKQVGGSKRRRRASRKYRLARRRTRKILGSNIQ